MCVCCLPAGEGVASAMTQCEDEDEGAPPSKTGLCLHGNQTKAKSPALQNTHHSPEPGPEPEAKPEPEPGSEHGPGPWSGSEPADKESLASMEPPLVFQDSDDRRVDKENLEVSSDHQAHLDSIFMLLEKNIVTFMRSELKKLQMVARPDCPECSESLREEEEVLNGEEDEQRRSSKEAFLKIVLDFLRGMKQQELADRLQSRKRISLKVQYDGEMAHYIISQETY